MKDNLTALTETGDKTENQSSKSNTENVPIVAPEIQAVNLYAVAHKSRKTNNEIARPFIHKLYIITQNGGTIGIQANFDDGALVNAMSTTKFSKVKDLLGHYGPSSTKLCMADGNIIKAVATWEGEIEIEGVRARGSFEVFDSGNNWEFLFGKPLLKTFSAIHDYKVDEVVVESRGVRATLRNQINTTPTHQAQQTAAEQEREATPKNGETSAVTTSPENSTTIPIHNIVGEEHTQEDNTSTETTEIEIEAFMNNDNVFTRATDPWKPARVEEILKQITVGPNLSDVERDKTFKFIAEWADVFALS